MTATDRIRRASAELRSGRCCRNGRRPIALERLEPRALLSADGLELGPQTGFNDHPYVDVEVFSGDVGLGPYDSGFGIFPYDYMLLDTGANSILIVSDAAAELESNGLQTEGKYLELGIGGYTEFDVSARSRFDFRGSDGITHTLPQTETDVRVLSGPDVHLGGQSAMIGGLPGVVGMPTMAGRVTSLDLRAWDEVSDPLEIGPIEVSFAQGPDALPAGNGHRYSVAVDDRTWFDPRAGLPPDSPPDAPLPVWAPVPMMTAVVSHQGNRQEADFLFDTGAQLSLLSEDLAKAAGLDADGDGDLLDDALYTLPIGGIGGTIEVPVMLVEQLRLPTTQGVDLIWKAPDTYDFGVAVTPTDGSTRVGESGDTDAYQVVLTGEPLADVTIELHSADGQLSAVDDAQRNNDFLVFTRGNWDVPQTVHVAALDDLSWEGPHQGMVLHTAASGDPDFDGVPIPGVVVDVDDDESTGPGVQVVPPAVPIELSESGGQVTYQIVLGSRPTAEVTVELISADGQAAAVDHAQPANDFLVFGPEDWDVPQTVRLTAVDNDLIEGDHTGTIVHRTATGDPDYQQLPAGSTTVGIRDNDGGLELLVLDVTEGIDGVFGIDLLTSGLDLTLDLATFEFEIFGAPYFDQVHFDFRNIFDGSGMLHFDVAETYDHGVSVRQGGAATDVAEGGATDTYQLVLTSQPTADVTVRPVNIDGQLAAVDDAEAVNDFLVFTPDDWDTPQVVRVTAVDDDAIEGPHSGRIVHVASSDDPAFDGTTIADVTAGIEDNDASAVTGRHVFYNNSLFDGNDRAAHVADDGAVAPDKRALLPGQTADFSNYTGYVRGINGIMVDMTPPPVGAALSVDDFRFRIGNGDDPADWTAAPAPRDFTVRPGEGVDGSDRVTLVWDDNAIQNAWLQVTVLATDQTRLPGEDVFYFGNAIGETGNSTLDAKVNSYDMLAARNNQRSFLDPAPIDFNYDFNRDALVNAVDMLIARDNPTHFLNALRLITAPQSQAATQRSADTKGAGWLAAERSEAPGTTTLGLAAKRSEAPATVTLGHRCALPQPPGPDWWHEFEQERPEHQRRRLVDAALLEAVGGPRFM